MIGNLFYGGDGWMCVDDRGFQVYKGEKSEKIMEEKGGGKENSHFQNFISAVKSRNPKDLTADVEIGVTSAALVHLGNISYRLGRKLKFDPKTLTCPGDAAANAMLTRKYRAPYIVPVKV